VIVNYELHQSSFVLNYRQANIENEFDSEDNSNTLAYLPEEQNVSIPEPPPLPPQVSY